MNRELTVRVNVVPGRNDRVQLYSNGRPESMTTSPIRPIQNVSPGFAGMGLSSTGQVRSNYASYSLGYYQSEAAQAARQRVQEIVSSRNHAMVVERQIAMESEARRKGIGDAVVGYNASPSSTNLGRVVALVREAVANANPRTREKRDWIERQQEMNVLEANDRYRTAKLTADVNPTVGNKNALADVLSSLKSQYAPGSPEYTRALREEIDLRKQLIRTGQQENRQRLIAEHGWAFGTAKYAQMQSANAMGQVGAVAAYGQGGIMGAVAAGSPDTMSTYLKSWQLLSGEIGIAFVPAMARASQMIQSTATWIEGMDDKTKKNAASLVFWGTAAAAGTYALSKLGSAGIAVFESFGKVRGAVLGAMGAVTQFSSMQSVGGVATGRPSSMGYPGPSGVMGWVRNNPAIIGGFAGAGLSAYGYMNPESPMSRYATLAGNSMMLGGFLTPAGAGWGAFGRASVATGVALDVGQRLLADTSYSARPAPNGLPPNAEAQREVMNRLLRHESSMLNWMPLIGGFRAQSRVNDVDSVMRRYGLSASEAGITADTVRGGPGMYGLVNALGPERIQEIARTVGNLTAGRTPNQTNTEEQARRLENQGRHRDAANLRLTDAERRRDEFLWSTNFQPQQIPIESLHGMVQNEMIRSPLDQRIMEQQMRGLETLIEEVRKMREEAERARNGTP